MRRMVSFVFVLLLCPMLLQGDLAPEMQEEEPQAVIITVDSTNLRFSPSSVTVVEGDTVRFFWSGQALHTMRLNLMKSLTLESPSAMLIIPLPSKSV